MTRDQLVEKAREARTNAHAPYSSYAVGAALATAGPDPKVFTGANVENASYGATVCAERVALFSAVSAGHQSFTAIAVATPGKKAAPPCGLCLQVLGEFCDDLVVYCAAEESDEIVETTLRALLPKKFTL
jgi:cytidine deaminase